MEYKSAQKHIVTYDDFHLKDQVEFTFTHMMMNSFIWFWFQTSYRLHLGHKTGDNIGNFRYSNNMAFTTFDHDQDNYSGNCPIHNGGKGFYYWAPVLWMISAPFILDRSHNGILISYWFHITTDAPTGVSWTLKEPAQTKNLCWLSWCASISPKLNQKKCFQESYSILIEC